MTVTLETKKTGDRRQRRDESPFDALILQADMTDADGTAVHGSVPIDFDEGLVPVIAQDADSGEVLMLAYASEQALKHTRETGEAHYHSRSRDELWHKGETSGHVQEVEEIRVDCDGDAVLYLVDQTGGACHTGHASCFYRTIDGDVRGERVFDPDTVYDS